MVAISQIGQPHSDGRAYFDRKVTEDEAKREPLRSLKRHVSNAICRQLVLDAQRGPCGHQERLVTSVVGSASEGRPFGEVTPGPIKAYVFVLACDGSIRRRLEGSEVGALTEGASDWGTPPRGLSGLCQQVEHPLHQPLAATSSTALVSASFGFQCGADPTKQRTELEDPRQ